MRILPSPAHRSPAARPWLRGFAAALLLAWMFAGGVAAVADDARAPVLILISRSPSDAWAVAELDGMLRTLGAARPPVQAVVEYMDVQSIPAPDYAAELAAYYRTKFAGHPFRVVLAADQPALDFLVEYRDSLFPSAQAAFCGISKFDPTLRRGRPWLAGVVENGDPAASFRLALTLQPDLQRFIILEDKSFTGRGQKQRIEEEMPEETKRVPLELLRADSSHALFTGVEKLPPRTAVLITRSIVARRMGPELLARCPVPIYGQRLPTHLGAMLGGAVIDGERHGEAAAQLGLRLLAGEKAADIPTVHGVPPRVIVDYEQMHRFGLPFGALPPGAEILNRPRRIWDEYPRATAAALGALASLSVLAAWLALALRQKRRNAAALKTSLSLLHATLEASTDGVFVVDTKGKVSGFNRRFCKLWRVPLELVEQGEDAAVIAFVREQVKESDAFCRRIAAIYSAPSAESFDIIECRDGRVFERHSQPQRLDDRIVGRVWTFADITARRKGEDTHRRLETKMAHTQRLEALGTLAGGIAHDFNNLLTAILGYAQLAHDSLAAHDPVRNDLDGVLAASERARDLVKQILTFSRKSPLERRHIQLETVVRDAIRLLRATIPTGVEIRSEIGDASDTVLADSSQVHQAILNLGTNAAHSLLGQPGTITVALDRLAGGENIALPEAGPCLCVTVRDTGAGMDAATLRQVFDPFFTTKNPGEGTGLGLAVVHGIMQGHDGAVTLESQPGEGTIARLFFPIVAAPVVEETAALPPLPPGDARRVLVVDDELLVLRVAEQSLQRLGYVVTTCASAPEALEVLKRGGPSFHALVTDLNMPQMTGTELAAEVRRRWPQTAIVLASGYLGDGTVEQRAGAIGIEEILAKPYSAATLAAALERAIEKAQARHPRQLTPIT